jgi:hypothetical protein
MPELVKIYWFASGKRHLYRELNQEGEFVITTSDGHVWLITNAAEVPIAYIEGTPDEPVIVIDGPGHGEGPSPSDPAAASAAPAPPAVTAISKHASLIIPAIQLTDATLNEATAFISAKVAELDPAKQPFRIAVDPRLTTNSTRLNLDVVNITVEEALNLLASRLNGQVTFTADTYLIKPR